MTQKQKFLELLDWVVNRCSNCGEPFLNERFDKTHACTMSHAIIAHELSEKFKQRTQPRGRRLPRQ